MHTQHQQLRFLLATVAVILAALVAPLTAGAAAEFIPGVTDSTTGVLRELDARFIPGVTDSTTGVLRDLDRNRLEHGSGAGHPSAGDSGLEGDAAVALGGALVALVAIGTVALVAGAKRRRVAI